MHSRSFLCTENLKKKFCSREFFLQLVFMAHNFSIMPNSQAEKDALGEMFLGNFTYSTTSDKCFHQYIPSNQFKSGAISYTM